MKDKRSKILVVDDEASIRRLLEIRLSLVGYEVVTAADGLEALDIFHQEVPDLVILDVMLPKLDGYGVCQKLRQESNIPIIMLTALRDVADRLMGLELGADDVISRVEGRYYPAPLPFRSVRVSFDSHGSRFN